MKKILLLCNLIFFISVFFIFYNHTNYFWYPESDPIGIFSEKSAKKLNVKYGWHPAGGSVSSPGGVLKEVGIHFQVQGPKSQDEIRELIITAAQELIGDFNKDEHLVSKLEHPPANEKNIEIILFFVDKDRSYLKDPFITCANFINGVLRYKIYKDVYNEFFKRDLSETVWESKETYEEALELVRKSQNDSLK